MNENKNNQTNQTSSPQMDHDGFNQLVENEARLALFTIIRRDLTQDPPRTESIKSVINQLIEGLTKFVPSKTKVHEQIRAEIFQDEINLETMPTIILGLIGWIEKFQCPADDEVTRGWRNGFREAENYTEFIIKFLAEYYDHSEKVYREVWEARKRLLDGENVIPPEHRREVKGVNGVPNDMKTGRR